VRPPCWPMMPAANHVGAGMRTGFTDEKVDVLPNRRMNSIWTACPLCQRSVTITSSSRQHRVHRRHRRRDANKVGVLDAIARFEFSDELNIWAGRFLPPSDRANLHGPYYANEWSVYIDGVQDGYASVATGRDDGVAYWDNSSMTCSA